MTRLKHKYAAYIVAIKNDFCLEESIVELFRQGVSRVVIISPLVYWLDETPQSVADFREMHEIANRTGAELRPQYFKASGGQVNATNHAMFTEALYRNCGVECLLSDPSIDIILTVDSDELWLPGNLEHIDSLVEPGRLLKISLPCVPTIGVPGLPIDGALDSVLVATSRDARFTWGRATTNVEAKKGTMRMLHFTATRKTLAEVIDKHRKSAHYSDPTYDFEGWIKNVLPRVRVGMRDVHMYRSPDNIWPLIRSWTAEEAKAIPATLHPWLSF